MGQYWQEFGYASPYALAESTAMSEKDIPIAGPIYRNQSVTAIDEEYFHRSGNLPCLCPCYNGSNYEKFDYHNKLAAAMK
jgi:hypothetical protein